MPADASERSFDLDAVVRRASAHLAASTHRIPSVDVQRQLARRFSLNRRQARAVIRRLVTIGDLVYTCEHGSSFLEHSYRKPVKVGDRVVLIPSDHSYRAAVEEVAVRIAPGAAFGSGRHPTTRLAIRGVEQALKHLSPDHPMGQTDALDIGTGSGVLVIAAVKLGVGRGVGIDTDPNARFEARQNVCLNRLAARIRIVDTPVAKIKPTGLFFLVTANLRLPTLVRLAAAICNLTQPAGRLVLSGIRAEEREGLREAYQRHHFCVRWEAVEKEWGAMVLQPGA